MDKLLFGRPGLHLVRSGSLPLHRQLRNDLRRAIRDGSLRPGSAIPSEADLGAAYNVSRGTVRQALAALRAEGLIAGGRGAQPVVVRAAQLTQPFTELLSFSAWARALGKTPSGRVIEFVRRPADEATAAALDVAPGTPVDWLVRVRLADGLALMIERTAFVADVGALVADLDLARESIYAALAALDVVFARAHQSIDALAAPALDARLLGIRAGAPLLRVRRRTLSPAGRPLEWSDDRYRPDLVGLTIDNSAKRPVVTRRLAAGEG